MCDPLLGLALRRIVDQEISGEDLIEKLNIDLHKKK